MGQINRCDKWCSPYLKDRTTKRFTYKRKGCYLIRDKFTKEILYVGMSNSNVYSAMYHHFNKWNDHPCRVVLDRNNCEIRVFVDLKEPHRIEKRLIKFFCPKCNHERYVKECESVELTEEDKFWLEEPIKECQF